MKAKFRITRTTVEITDFKAYDSIEAVLAEINRLESEQGVTVACINDKGESIVGGEWKKINRTKR
jgi:hypothetical protein